FRFQVRKTVAIFRLAAHLEGSDYPAALDYVRRMEPELLTAYPRVDEEKQWELYFYSARACYHGGDRKSAHGHIRTVMQQYRLHAAMPVCRATRLLNMLIHYEQGDTEYLTYEMRSHRRFFRQA